MRYGNELFMDKKVKCKLCGEYYCNEDMSEEHYPARSVGNEDIVAFNFSEYLSVLSTGELNNCLESFWCYSTYKDLILDRRLTLSPSNRIMDLTQEVPYAKQ